MVFSKITEQSERKGYPIIKVIGVGLTGCNAVKNINSKNITGVDLITIDTDEVHISSNDVEKKPYINKSDFDASITKSSRLFSEEIISQVKESVEYADLVFVITGFENESEVLLTKNIAEQLHEYGVLTFFSIIELFGKEDACDVVEKGVLNFRGSFDSLMTITSEKLQYKFGNSFVTSKSIVYANEVVYEVVKGISELIYLVGTFNVDFEDLRTVLSKGGMAGVGVGRAHGKNRARLAAEFAISNSLLDEETVSGSGSILLNITSGLDKITFDEFMAICDVLGLNCGKDEDARVIIGSAVDELMIDDISVTIIVTGFDGVSAA